MRRARPNCRPAARWRGLLRAPILRAQSATRNSRVRGRRDEEEPSYEPRPARGHPFPWLQVPPAPAPAESREPSYEADRSHEEPASRDRLPRSRLSEPRPEPPYSEPPLTASTPAAHPSYAQPARRWARALRADLRRSEQAPASSTAITAAGTYPTVPDQQYAAERYAAETEPRTRITILASTTASTTRPIRRRGSTANAASMIPATPPPRMIRATLRASMTSTANTIRATRRRASTTSTIRATPPPQEDQYDDEYEYADDEDGYADEEPKRRNLVKIALAGGARRRGGGDRRRVRLSRHVPWRQQRRAAAADPRRQYAHQGGADADRRREREADQRPARLRRTHGVARGAADRSARCAQRQWCAGRPGRHRRRRALSDRAFDHLGSPGLGRRRRPSRSGSAP